MVENFGSGYTRGEDVNTKEEDGLEEQGSREASDVTMGGPLQINNIIKTE